MECKAKAIAVCMDAIALWQYDAGSWCQSKILRCSGSEPVLAFVGELVAVMNGKGAALINPDDGEVVSHLYHDSICTLGTMMTKDKKEVLCTGSFHGTVHVWLDWMNPIRFPSQGANQVNVLLGVSSGKLFVGCCNGGYLWDLERAECLVSFGTPDPDPLGDCGDWFSAADVLQASFCVGGRKGILSIWSFDGQALAMNDIAHRGQWIQAIRFAGVGKFCSASQDTIFLWSWSNANEHLEKNAMLWGHTAVISRLAFLPEATLVSTAQNGEVIWWDLCSMMETGFRQCHGVPAGLTVVKGEALCFLLDGRLAEHDGEIGWSDLVPGIPTRMPGQLAVLRFACSLRAEGRAGGHGSRESENEFEKMLIHVVSKFKLPLQIEDVFQMGSSSRSTYVAAPHMTHAPADFDIGIRLAPGNIEPECLYSILLTETERVLKPVLSHRYVAIDQCLSGHSLQQDCILGPSVCDRCQADMFPGEETYRCSRCDYDVCISCMKTPEPVDWTVNWDCQLARFGVKITRHLSRAISCSIDLVPFQRVGEGDFPQLALFDRQTLQWLPNNPPLFTHHFNLRTQEDAFLGLVATLMKYWNCIQSVDEYGKPPLKGMHLECLLLAGCPKTDNFAEAVAIGFEYCAKHVLDSDVQPPGGSLHIGPSYIEPGRRQYVQRLLRSAASLARFACESEDAEAAWNNQSVGAWSHLLCESRWQDDGHAFFSSNPFLEWSSEPCFDVFH